ncbi:MAG: fimbrillin family protein [Rikenellaceae bacterium]
MKRLFLSVAVLAAFASCSKNEVTDVAPSNLGSEIGFTTLNDRITKSATDNGDSYQVFSLQSTAEAGVWYINEEVSDADAIISGAKYYWPVDGSTLAFYAYAPASVSATATVTDTPEAEITIDYVVPAKADQDFTVAEALDFGDEIANDVNLKFSHKLSKVTISVALSEALTKAGYYVDATRTAYTATFDVNFDSEEMDVVTGAWDGTQSKSTAYAAYSGTTSYMFLPQEAEGCSITIGNLVLYADVVDEEAETTATTAVLGAENPITLSAYNITGIDMADFEEGTHYYITITIDGSTDDDEEEDLLEPIAFASELAADWTTPATTTVYATDVNVSSSLIETSESDVAANGGIYSYSYTSGYEIYSVATNGTETLIGIEESNDAATAIITEAGLGTYASLASTPGTYTNNEDYPVSLEIYQVITTTTYSVSNAKYLVKVYSASVSATSTL